MDKNEPIIVEHENGYKGVLYGRQSMSIYYEGKEVLHTGFRNKDIQTKEDLYKHLEEMPEFMGAVDEIFKDLWQDEAG